MKTVYIDDELHKKLKEEAIKKKRRLQAFVEELLIESIEIRKHVDQLFIDQDPDPD